MALPRHLHVFLRPRLEDLAAGLAEACRRFPPRHPLDPLRISVSARGTERWLRQQLAGPLGVVWQLEAPFPRAVILDVLAHLTGGRRPDPAFTRANLAWAIFHLLPERLPLPVWQPVTRYLADGDPRRRWQLAGHLARMFEDLQWQRPALIRAWERPPAAATDWRADLWQALRALWPDRPAFPDLYFAAGQLPDSGLQPWPGQPLHFFAVHDLPAPALDLLWKVAAVVPVQFHLLSPSPLYAGDLAARPFAGWPDPSLDPGPLPGADAPAGGPDSGLPEGAAPDHPLVAANHYALREFLDLLLDREAVVDSAGDIPDPAEAGSTPPAHLLAALQRDLHNLRESPPGSAAHLPVTVEVVAAPNLRREVEDLRDAILGAFAADPTLRPRDVIVLAPDLEAYAPYLDAVLADPPAGEPTFPYTLADRHPRAEHALADAFLTGLDLAASRFAAPEVLAWLELPPVRQRFRLGETDLTRLRGWLPALGIHWGRDAAQVRELGLPPEDAPTWERGLNTLLLGLAADGTGPRLLEGIHPWEHLTGGAIQTLDRIVEAFGFLRELSVGIAGEHPLPDWLALLRDWLAALAGPPDRPAATAAGDGAAVNPRAALAALDDALGAIGAAPVHQLRADPVPFRIVRAALEETLGNLTAASGNFLAGAVTLAPLQPLRALPCRYLAVLGLADGAFPRLDHPPEFSPLARRRPGEHSSRHHDRQLFLDLLLSARDHLRISYPAGEGRSGSLTPPSIVVAELLDVLGRLRARPAAGTEAAGTAAGPLKPEPPWRVAPLQAFSPDAFAAPETAGFSPAEAAAATVLAAARAGKVVPPPPFHPEPLPPFPALPLVLSPAEFADALAHPLEAFARLRLGLTSGWEDDEPAEIEPFGLTPLARSRLLLALAAAPDADSRANHLAAFAARGQLPGGLARPAITAELDHAATDLASRAAGATRNRSAEPLPISLDLGPIRVRGQLDRFHPAAPGGAGEGPLRLHLFGGRSIRAHHRLRAVFRHLLANAVSPGTTTVLLSTEETFTLRPIPEAVPHLAIFAHLLIEGLSSPLPLPPATTWEYLTRKLRPSPRARTTPDDAARSTFATECDEDPLVARLLAGRKLPDDAFRRLTDGPWSALLDFALPSGEDAPAAGDA